MAEQPALHHYTYRDYLAHDSASNTKHEFLGGEIYAMAGGTPLHAALASACTVALSLGLEGSRCRVYSSDLRIRVMASDLATYPDVSVVCGELECDPESAITVTNPTLLLEVLSDSTEAYDRGEKLLHYQRIPSLRHVLLVAQDRRAIDVWHRTESGWASSRYGDGDTIALEGLALSIDVRAIYERAGG